MAPGESKVASRRAETSARRRFIDRFAKYFVTVGGLAIIASVLGIFVFMAAEVAPLFRDARISPGKSLSLTFAPEAAVVDEYQTYLEILQKDGRISIVDLEKNAAAGEFTIPEIKDKKIERACAREGVFHAVLADGREAAVASYFDIDFKDGKRIVTPKFKKPVLFNLNSKSPSEVSRLQIGGKEVRGLAAVAGDHLIYIKRTAATNAFSGEVEEDFSKFEAVAPKRARQLLVDSLGQNIYVATAAGEIVRFRILENKLSEPQVESVGGAAVSAMDYLLGDQSLVIGQADGSISVWFLVGNNQDSQKLTKIREFNKLDSKIVAFAPSTREKSFFALSENGALRLAHSTAERILWEGISPIVHPRGIFYTPKADGLLTFDDARLESLKIDNPHPEVSASALFGKVWYENNIEPEYTWQSSPGSNDIEAKFSLTPIVFGTLKGTFYSLLLAIPLAVLAAMYTSQFLPWTVRRYVKPVVEIMASLPSVVIGFLAGLWLAPRVASGFVAVMLMLIFMPAFVLGFGMLGKLIPTKTRHRLPQGGEIISFMIALALGGYLAISLSGPVEHAFFGGDFQAWLLRTTGAELNQSNSIVVGMAMGFAVIPIIFAVSEDAFSNVPQSLISASLALGANRWETVTRVVLPTASPGIFSGIMIGFGRAVGETMIVVMATGVTATMDWSPLNGFRTLSANIANEIPEAAHGGTLYRILFLSGLLLFAFTFTVNTAAEMVRQRLRKKYSSL